MLIDFNKLVSWSIQLYKKNVGVYLKYTLLSLVPYLLMMVLFAIGGVSLIMTGVATDSFGIVGVVGLIVGLLAVIALSVVGMWFNIAFVKAANGLYNGQTTMSVGERLRESKPLILRTIGTSLLVGLYTAGPILVAMLVFAIGSFLAGSGGGQFMKILMGIAALVGLFGAGFAIYMSVKLVFSVYAVMIDELHAREAMQKSKSMVEGRWLGVFGRLLGAGVIFWLIGILAMMFLGFIAGLIPNTVASMFVGQALTSIVQLLLTPLFMNMLIVLYNETKKVPVTATPVAQPTPATPPPTTSMN